MDDGTDSLSQGTAHLTGDNWTENETDVGTIGGVSQARSKLVRKKTLKMEDDLEKTPGETPNGNPFGTDWGFNLSDMSSSSDESIEVTDEMI